MGQIDKTVWGKTRSARLPDLRVSQESKPNSKQRGFFKRHKIMASIIGLVVGLVLLNASLVVIGRNTVPRQVKLGSMPIAGMSYEKVRDLPGNIGLEQTITLIGKGKTKASLSPLQLGLAVDRQASYNQLRKSYIRWLPIVGWFKTTVVPITTRINSTVFNAGLQTISQQFELTPQDYHIAFNGSAFAVAAPSDGYKVDSSKLANNLLDAVARDRSVLHMPLTTVKPVLHNTDLSSQVTTLNKQLTINVSYATYGGAKIQPNATQKAAWYQADGQSLTLSTDKIQNYLTQLATDQHLSLLNQHDLVTATQYALTHQQSLNFRLVTQGNHLRTYCTAVRGVDVAALDDLVGKLAAVYADERGWNDQGQLGFEHVDRGCQYTVWLSSADQMGSFGAICDDFYNCQVGGNVVVNNDRWTTATPPWTATGGSLEDYRVLIIDHETGHRLGFLDNPICPGPGQPAYVMMQQSIDLKGCTFNIWPTQTELEQLKSML